MVMNVHVNRPRCVCGKIPYSKKEAKLVVKHSRSMRPNIRKEDDYYKKQVLTGVYKCREGQNVWHTTSRIEWGE